MLTVLYRPAVLDEVGNTLRAAGGAIRRDAYWLARRLSASSPHTRPGPWLAEWESLRLQDVAARPDLPDLAHLALSPHLTRAVRPATSGRFALPLSHSITASRPRLASRRERPWSHRRTLLRLPMLASCPCDHQQVRTASVALHGMTCSLDAEGASRSLSIHPSSSAYPNAVKSRLAEGYGPDAGPPVTRVDDLLVDEPGRPVRIADVAADDCGLGIEGHG